MEMKLRRSSDYEVRRKTETMLRHMLKFLITCRLYWNWKVDGWPVLVSSFTSSFDTFSHRTFLLSCSFVLAYRYNSRRAHIFYVSVFLSGAVMRNFYPPSLPQRVTRALQSCCPSASIPIEELQQASQPRL
jgi:hypothetical protein